MSFLLSVIYLTIWAFSRGEIDASVSNELWLQQVADRSYGDAVWRRSVVRVARALLALNTNCSRPLLRPQFPDIGFFAQFHLYVGHILNAHQRGMRLADVTFNYDGERGRNASELFVLAKLLESTNVHCGAVRSVVVVAQSYQRIDVHDLIDEFNLTHSLYPDFALMAILCGLFFDFTVPHIQAALTARRKTLGLPPLYFCVHVRRTDKLHGSTFHAVKKYADRIAHYVALHAPFLRNCTTYVMSDDATVPIELTTLRWPDALPAVHYVWDEQAVQSAALTRRYATGALLSLLLDVDVCSDSHFAVGTLSSNVYRFIGAVKMFRFGPRALFDVATLPGDYFYFSSIAPQSRHFRRTFTDVQFHDERPAMIDELLRIRDDDSE
jgi:hypothetical protein